MNNKPPKIRFDGNGEWRIRKFGDLITKVSSTTDSNKFPMVEYADVNAGKGTLNKDINSKMNIKKGTKFIEDDILFGKLRPYLKNWLLADFEGIAVGDWWVLRTLDSHDSKFVYSLIQSEKFLNTANLSTGTKMPRSDWETVYTSKYFVPQKKEQTKIGNFFKELDELIELQQASISNLEKTKKGIQMKFLSEGEKTKIEFKDLSESSRKKIKLKDIYKFYRGKHIGLKDISTSGENKAIAYGQLYTTYSNVIEVVEGKSDKEGTIGIKNDLLFPTSSTVPRGTSQATALMVDNVQIGGDIIIARPKEKNAIDSRYFSYMISANKDKIIKIIEGTTIAHIYAKDVGKLEYEISEFEIQKRIASFLLNTEHLIELEQTELELLKEMKKGFLQKMFV